MRNYKRENELLNQNKERVEIRVPKELGLKFKEALKKQGLSINQWGKQKIEEYLDKFPEKP